MGETETGSQKVGSVSEEVNQYHWADDLIQEAMARGDFDDIKGRKSLFILLTT